MKDEYFTPIADMLAFNYASVVSASFDTHLTPNKQNSNKCTVAATKNKPKNCGGDEDPIITTKKNKNC